MNRKQRRATRKAGPPATGVSERGDLQVGKLLFEAAERERAGKLDDAARIYRRALILEPDHAEASNNLGRVLLAQGKTAEASASFARSLALMPQLLKQYSAICATLVALLPPLKEALRRQTSAWPRRLSERDLLDDDGVAAIADDPLLLYLMHSVPMQDVAFERLLTALRASLLESARAGRKISAAILNFACALAQQCFINEYIFATTTEEDAQVDQLKSALELALSARSPVEPIQLAVLAMYQPLNAWAPAPILLDGSWPPSIDDVLTRQLREPLQERALRDCVPRLTAIDDKISKSVQQQYEENPYPRWLHAARQMAQIPIDQYLREQFPTSAFTSTGKADHLDMLIAGCGTGEIAIASVQKYSGAQALAIDLSLSSLCYARRSTPTEVAPRIEYAQADILNLAAIGRSFDAIDASGVLHHMADPLEGWRILLGLLRPSGLMHLGLYSEAGRQDVAAARAFIAERGFGSTAAEIRRCRQELLKTPLAGVTRFADFFSTSECRDLLFHVQEARMTIPAIRNFLAAHDLRFIGFEFDPAAAQRYCSQFAASGWSITDLNRWHDIETRFPDTFSGMYHFWVQKT